jgi:hypothetical protein
MIRWLADFTSWWRWRRTNPIPWANFRAITERVRQEGKPVYVRGWRARWGN